MEAASHICRLSGLIARQIAVQTILYLGGVLLATLCLGTLVLLLLGVSPSAFTQDFAFHATQLASQALLAMGTLAVVFAAIAGFGSCCLYWSRGVKLPDHASEWIRRYYAGLPLLLAGSERDGPTSLATTRRAWLAAPGQRAFRAMPAALSGAVPRLE